MGIINVFFLGVFHRTVVIPSTNKKVLTTLQGVRTKKNNALADKKLITYKPIQIFGQFHSVTSTAVLLPNFWESPWLQCQREENLRANSSSDFSCHFQVR